MPLVIAVLSAVLVGLPVVPDYPDRGDPLDDRALRADLEERGYRNGYMPEESLTEADSGTRKTCLLEEQAAESWNRLMVHAVHDGIDLRAASCYRSFRAQKSAYEHNCPVEKIPHERPVTVVDEEGNEQVSTVTEYTSERVCRVPTARPGNSNHSWGRAMDVSTRRGLLTCRSTAFRWLKDNAHLYGWVHPPWAGCGRNLEEAWHWEWAGTAEQTPVAQIRNYTD